MQLLLALLVKSSTISLIKDHPSFIPDFHSTSFMCFLYSYTQILCLEKYRIHIPNFWILSCSTNLFWCCGVVVREYFFETLHNNVILSSPFWEIVDPTLALTLRGEEEQPNEQTEIGDIAGESCLFRAKFSLCLEYTEKGVICFSALSTVSSLQTATDRPRKKNTLQWQLHMSFVAQQH